jgi:Tfp pilus assembly protein PilV
MMAGFKKNPKKLYSSGFTIAETLIATLLVTVILVTVISLITSFTNHYYKAVNSSSTQIAAQSVLNAVSQGIEYSSASTSSPQYSNGTTNGGAVTIDTWCVGNVQFDYTDVFQSTGPYPNAIWETPNSSGCSSIAPQSNSQQLLGPNMQILRLNVCLLSNCPGGSPSAPALYQVDVVVAFGPDNLLCDTTNYPYCPATGANTGFNTGITPASTDNFSCVQSSGSQYCDVEELTLNVGQRLQ